MSYFDDFIEPALLRDCKTRRSARSFSGIDYSSMPWQSADGKKMSVSEMTDSHLRNAHKLLGGRIGCLDEKDTDLLYYGILRGEINRRIKERSNNEQG